SVPAPSGISSRSLHDALPILGMRAATKYKFMIIASPAGPFFSRPIKLYAETQYIRAAVGGTGEAKAAGNYAAAILPTELAKKKRSEEHTSELQSREKLVCRLL